MCCIFVLSLQIYICWSLFVKYLTRRFWLNHLEMSHHRSYVATSCNETNIIEGVLFIPLVVIHKSACVLLVALDTNKILHVYKLLL